MFGYFNRRMQCQRLLDRLSELEHRINISEFSNKDSSNIYSDLVQYLCCVIDYNTTKYWFQKPTLIPSGILQRIKRHYV